MSNLSRTPRTARFAASGVTRAGGQATLVFLLTTLLCWPVFTPAAGAAAIAAFYVTGLLVVTLGYAAPLHWLEQAADRRELDDLAFLLAWGNPVVLVAATGIAFRLSLAG